MTFKQMRYYIDFKMSSSDPQEQKEFNTEEAARDFQKTVHLLGGVSVFSKKEITIGIEGLKKD